MVRSSNFLPTIPPKKSSHANTLIDFSISSLQWTLFSKIKKKRNPLRTASLTLCILYPNPLANRGKTRVAHMINFCDRAICMQKSHLIFQVKSYLINSNMAIRSFMPTKKKRVNNQITARCPRIGQYRFLYSLLL